MISIGHRYLVLICLFTTPNLAFSQLACHDLFRDIQTPIVTQITTSSAISAAAKSWISELAYRQLAAEISYLSYNSLSPTSLRMLQDPALDPYQRVTVNSDPRLYTLVDLMLWGNSRREALAHLRQNGVDVFERRGGSRSIWLKLITSEYGEEQAESLIWDIATGRDALTKKHAYRLIGAEDIPHQRLNLTSRYTMAAAAVYTKNYPVISRLLFHDPELSSQALDPGAYLAPLSYAAEYNYVDVVESVAQTLKLKLPQGTDWSHALKEVLEKAMAARADTRILSAIIDLGANHRVASYRYSDHFMAIAEFINVKYKDDTYVQFFSNLGHKRLSLLSRLEMRIDAPYASLNIRPKPVALPEQGWDGGYSAIPMDYEMSGGYAPYP